MDKTCTTVSSKEISMRFSNDELEELKELLAQHEQHSDCQRTGTCCSPLLIEFLEELVGDR